MAEKNEWFSVKKWRRDASLRLAADDENIAASFLQLLSSQDRLYDCEPLPVCLLLFNQTLFATESHKEAKSYISIPKEYLPAYPEIDKCKIEGITIECSKVYKLRLGTVVARLKVEVDFAPGLSQRSQSFSHTQNLAEGEQFSLERTFLLLGSEIKNIFAFEVKSIDFKNNKVLIGPIN